jgi:hypothetical protein
MRFAHTSPDWCYVAPVAVWCRERDCGRQDASNQDQIFWSDVVVGARSQVKNVPHYPDKTQCSDDHDGQQSGLLGGRFPITYLTCRGWGRSIGYLLDACSLVIGGRRRAERGKTQIWPGLFGKITSSTGRALGCRRPTVGRRATPDYARDGSRGARLHELGSKEATMPNGSLSADNLLLPGDLLLARLNRSAKDL